MAEWIWYPGDFELYHAMKQNFSRVERGYGWPAFWKSEGFRNRVVFKRMYVLNEETSFQVFSKAIGFCLVEAEGREKKYSFGQQISCGPGPVEISVHAGCIETFPSIYIQGEVICSGDAYQSFFVNQYLMAGPDINRRTLLALRGNDPMVTHINTILDYSLYWILGVKAHYDAYGDMGFLEQVYPKMRSLMDFCEEQLDSQGFLVGREGDWIFLDWADFDREGPLCGEQMLYCACWRAMAETAAVLGLEQEAFLDRYQELKGKILEYYWEEGKGAFVDSFSSGRKHVTRHANIFAILFDLAEEGQKRTILTRVLNNPEIPAITTPYFKFYEMDALCRMGCYREVLAQIREYWGGMLERGAVTFWEEYDPGAPEEEQYDMYGDRFGKSLCHAWAASPIYLLAKYFVGLQITDPVSGEYRLEPHLEEFGQLDCILPVGDRQLHIQWDKRHLEASWIPDEKRRMK